MIINKNIKLINGDCLTEMEQIENKSIDLIICDLPFGTTNCQWDEKIPLNDYIEIKDSKKKKKLKLNYEDFIVYCFNKNVFNDKKTIKNYFDLNKKKGLWSHYNRIIKDNGAILLFSQCPFTMELGNSNLKMLRYEWIWEKTQGTGFLNANKMPLKCHESILCFYKKLPIYNPQKTKGHPKTNNYTKYIATQNNTEIYGKTNKEISGGGETERFPRSVQIFSSDKQQLYIHSTQKPEKLISYLIKTYTNKNAIILDNCMGSGTTGISVIKCGENRSFIGIELDKGIFEKAVNRIKDKLKNNEIIDKFK